LVHNPEALSAPLSPQVLSVSESVVFTPLTPAASVPEEVPLIPLTPSNESKTDESKSNESNSKESDTDSDMPDLVSDSDKEKEEEEEEDEEKEEEEEDEEDEEEEEEEEEEDKEHVCRLRCTDDDVPLFVKCFAVVYLAVHVANLYLVSSRLDYCK
jgi:hypothetical protein